VPCVPCVPCVPRVRRILEAQSATLASTGQYASVPVRLNFYPASMFKRDISRFAEACIHFLALRPLFLLSRQESAGNAIHTRIFAKVFWAAAVDM
jgi:hypothetical protein